MSMTTRALLVAAVSGTAALTLMAGAAPAVALGNPFAHRTLAQAKHAARRELAGEVPFLRRYEAVVSRDAYLGSASRSKAVASAKREVTRVEQAEARISRAETRQQVNRALSDAFPVARSGHPGHRTLRQQKNAAQLELDGLKALIEQRRARAAQRPERHHPNFAKKLRKVDKIKHEVDQASTKRQLERLKHAERHH